MKVFISWSGERSEALAKALREWFPLVLHYVDPWLSKSDIQAGERWSVEIAKELEACNFGIICITKENINAPWILFEAGALAKSMQDGRVIPLLLDVDFKEITGPLAQFQAKKVENSGVKELVLSLNKTAVTPVPENQVERLFAALWSDLEKQIAAIPKSSAPTKHSRPQGEILEELVSGIRNVEMRVRDLSDDQSPMRRKHNRRSVQVSMQMEIAHRLSDHQRDPIRILLIASLFREQLPWLYELAVEVFHSQRLGHDRHADRIRRQFIDAVEILENGAFVDHLGIDPYVFHVFAKELHSLQRPARVRDNGAKAVATPTVHPEDVATDAKPAQQS